MAVTSADRSDDETTGSGCCHVDSDNQTRPSPMVQNLVRSEGRVADYRPPTWPEADVPKQFHLDLAVTDLQAAVDEAERLGATQTAFQPAPTP